MFLWQDFCVPRLLKVCLELCMNYIVTGSSCITFKKTEMIYCSYVSGSWFSFPKACMLWCSFGWDSTQVNPQRNAFAIYGLNKMRDDEFDDIVENDISRQYFGLKLLRFYDQHECQSGSRDLPVTYYLLVGSFFSLAWLLNFQYFR